MGERIAEGVAALAADGGAEVSEADATGPARRP
jgi:hypothetical protein